MTEITPFKAVIYNQQKVPDLSGVVCPPYDIISPEKQACYHELNKHNLIRILLGRDATGEDKYRRAAGYFKDWLKNKIFIQDQEPAIYFYSQEYKIKGEKKLRLGFISLLHLEGKDSSIFGHEHTRLEPKEDRFRLLKQVKANLSPIFAIFLDKKRIIQRTYQHHVQDKKPFINVADDEKTTHKLWRLDSPDIISNIQTSMLGENIFIADGHHRYEVACAYRELMKKKLGSLTGQEDFNYILTYFTNTDTRGLCILPVHRLLKFDSGINFDNLKTKLKDYFDIEEVREKNRFFFLMEKGGRTEHVLGMYKDRKFYLLRIKNIKILDKIITDKPVEYRSLDVVILNYLILSKILGSKPLDKEQGITFSPCAEEFIERVDNDPLCIAFFLNPVRIEQIISVALKGERMPPKSTYFYPKVLSGLVINKHGAIR